MLSTIMNVLSLVSNLLIVAFMAKSLYGFFTIGGKGNMKVKKTTAFRYFTVQSNLLMALASAIMLVFNVMLLFNDAVQIPYWVLVIKHVGTVAVMLTFCVVFFIFVPSTGVKLMIEGDSLYMHLISPILAFLALVLFDRGPALSYTSILWAMLPTLLYALLYYYMVMIRGEKKGGWEDFYKFNAKGRWFVPATSIFVITAAAGAVTVLLRNLLAAGLLS